MQRGIFTSVDHMICNHGDSLFNIYFTTPLLAGCFQDDDPTYQTSQFNNFNRVDNFDSDIWNNNEHFLPEEITNVMSELVKKTMSVRVESEEKNEEKSTPTLLISEVQSTPTLLISEVQSTPTLLISEVQSTPTEVIDIVGKPEIKQGFNIDTKFNELIKFLSVSDKSNIIKSLETLQSNKYETDKLIKWTSILYHIIKFKKSEAFIVSISKELQTFFNYVQTVVNNSEQKGKHSFNDLFETIVEIGKEKQTDQKKKRTLHCFKETSLTCEKKWLEELFETSFEQKELYDFSTVQNNDFVLYQHTSKGIQTVYYKALFDYLLSQKKQIYLLHISDEFGNDNIDLYEHKCIKHIFRNYFRNDLEKYKNVMVLPLGYNTKVSDGYESKSFEKKEYVWSFAGAIDRPGRIENLKSLDSLSPNFVKTKTTFGAKSSIEGDEYINMLNNSKFVPCFKGFSSLESFRLYEALEAGSIPVYVPSESRTGVDNEYTRVLGKNPLLAIPNWSAANMILGKVCGSPDVMEKHREEINKWWKMKKEELKQNIRAVY
jgi:hypothetical protein